MFRRVTKLTQHSRARFPAEGGLVAALASSRALFALGWPMTIGMVGGLVMGLVDTKLVGGLGIAALGGVGMGASLLFLCSSVLGNTLSGVKVRVAYAVGAKEPDAGLSYGEIGVFIAFVFGLIALVLSRHAGWVLGRIGIAPETIPYAAEYLASRSLGLPGGFIFWVLAAYRQGVGDSRSPMVVSLAGNVVNAALAYALIGGHFGLPALGVRGAGYATAAVETLQGVALFLQLLLDIRKAGRRRRVPAWHGAVEIFQLGLPTGLQCGLEMLAITTFTAILGTVGSEQIGAHAIAMAIVPSRGCPRTPFRRRRRSSSDTPSVRATRAKPSAS